MLIVLCTHTYTLTEVCTVINVNNNNNLNPYNRPALVAITIVAIVFANRC